MTPSTEKLLDAFRAASEEFPEPHKHMLGALWNTYRTGAMAVRANRTPDDPINIAHLLGSALTSCIFEPAIEEIKRCQKEGVPLPPVFTNILETVQMFTFVTDKLCGAEAIAHEYLQDEGTDEYPKPSYFGWTDDPPTPAEFFEEMQRKMGKGLSSALKETTESLSKLIQDKIDELNRKKQPKIDPDPGTIIEQILQQRRRRDLAN